MDGVALLVDHEVSDQITARTVEFPVFGRRLDQLPQLFEQTRVSVLELLGRGCDVDGEVTGREALDVHGADAVGEAAAVAQFEEQTPTLTRQDLRDHLQGQAIGVGDREPAKADHQVSLGPVLAQLGAADLARRRLVGGRRPFEGAGLEVRQPSGDPGRHSIRVDAA